MSDAELRNVIAQLLRQGRPMGDDIAAGSQIAGGGLYLTSLELVRLLVNLEDRLAIELDDGEIMNAQLETIDDIVVLVRGALPGTVA
jgi:acyl carrier protein